MLAKFSHIFGALVPERTCMVSVAFLKCCVTQSNVCFFCLWSRDLGLIYDVPGVTISLKWTGSLVAAITAVRHNIFFSNSRGSTLFLSAPSILHIPTSASTFDFVGKVVRHPTHVTKYDKK